MGKYYAVANGRSNGVYNNWSDCKSQVDGYSGAKFKSFATRAEANAFANRNSSTFASQSSYRGSSGGGSYSSSASRGSSPRAIQANSALSGTSSAANSEASRQVVFTDGSSLGNGRSSARAGWGVYWGDGDPRNQSGKVSNGEQTNNRGELQAIDRAVRGIASDAARTGNRRYEIRADSQYARDSVGKWANKWERNGWKTSSGDHVKNQDLIQSTRTSIQNLKASGVDVDITYIKAHAGHEGNEGADRLARDAAGS